MMSTMRGCFVTATVAAVFAGTQLIPASALAEPGVPPAEPGVQPSQPEPEMRNVTYKARVDGVSRGARISYRLHDEQVNTADPTMLPGRTFEATAVLSDPDTAGMTVSVDWPYSANLHCEILVDNQTVARADQFIAPRLTREDDDPLYGTLQCGAPLNVAGGPGNVVNTDPVAAVPEPGEAPPAPVDAPPAPADTPPAA